MPDTAKASWITDHAFEPRTKSVNVIETGATLPANRALCLHCRMAEAAHAQATSKPHRLSRTARIGGTHGRSTP